MGFMSTYRRVASLIAIVVTMVSTVTATEIFGCSTDDRCIVEYRQCSDSTPNSRDNVVLDKGVVPLVALCSSSSSSTLIPAVRTLHCASRSVARTSGYTHTVKAIDSTTVSQRYGLFNHKILFASLPRIQYLCRLMRLII